MSSLLKVQHLVKRFGGLAAVNHCNFEVAENSITALIGPNGAGKTTMFDIITGFTKPDGGSIIFRGTTIEKLSAYKRARLGIARTFQALRVFPELSALDNILLALSSGCEGNRKKRALELLEMIGLHEKAHAFAGSLSYGQQKLLEIIRAVATDADLFLFDEPAAGVNRTMLQTIIHAMKQLHACGKTIIIVEHDMGFVMSISQRIIVMDYGKEIAEGTPEEIQKNPKVLEAYLGQKRNQ